MSSLPILQMQSAYPLWLHTGGGLDGYGGISIYKVGDSTGAPKSYNIEDHDNPGFLLPYNCCALAFADTVCVWTNNLLLIGDEVNNRQDILTKGMLDLRLFGSKNLRRFINKNRGFLEKNLGITV